MRDFGCDILLDAGSPVDYRDSQPWSKDRLVKHGYSENGDRELIVSVLRFTQMLLERCGNRSIYASSTHLNDLLHSTDLIVIVATLRVGLELAQRYQASVKRVPVPSRQISGALLANHYNIELERVQCLAQPFVKTPIIKLSDPVPVTPASASKGKDKENPQGNNYKNVASMFANDLMAIATSGQSDEGRWNGWGDLKVVYFPKASADTQLPEVLSADRGSSSVPTTPTPLRRSSTAVPQTPRSGRGSDDSPSHRSSGIHAEPHGPSGPKSVEIRQSTIQSTSIYDLLKQCPADMSKASRYEFLNRLRICKALMGSTEDRQQALAARLLAITNLAYIHPEQSFIEKALKQDNDEPRRFQLVYQLAELILPAVDGDKNVPLWLQSIAMSLLEVIISFQSKHGDVLSALNANVNHGVLLYVIRKAVAGMHVDPENEDGGQFTDEDRWRDTLFSLALHVAMGSRVGQELCSAGLMDILVEMLNLRSKIATRCYSMVIAFLDSLVYGHQGAFGMLTAANGMDAISNLVIHTVSLSRTLTASGKGTKPSFHASLVDYDIPFYQQQTLKWLLKFTHHIMTNAFAAWGSSDRPLRNLVDNSALLGSLRSIIQDMRLFGSVVWTNAVTLLSDFINNDPTSFAAILESGMIQTFLEALTGRPVPVEQRPTTPKPEANDNDEHASISSSDDSVSFENDERPHPPTQAMLEAPREFPPARGILPSAEAISAIPSVLNSISLNTQGMMMVVSSGAIESYLEIFESPDHVHCMEMDNELATTIGGSFDELARHHPALRPTLGNAVIDMIARVAHLAKTKATTAGWGAKLEVTDPDGNIAVADRSLLEKAALVVNSKGKGKEKATAASDSDVEMADATISPVVTADEIPRLGPQATGETAPYKEITPYVSAVSLFLSSLIASATFKSLLVKEGGVELLLDLMEAPSVPDDFGENPASRILSQVVANIIESSQIVGLPSLLNRIIGVLDTLQPLITREESHPFFAPFLIPDLSLRDASGGWDQTVLRKVADGTPVVKALVSLQPLLRTLYTCFPYNSRHQLTTIPPVNVYDRYTRIIQDLGPLLREILTEEMSMASIVPPHWSQRKVTLGVSDSAIASGVGSREGGDGAAQDVLSASWTPADVDSAQAKTLSEEERATVQYRNLQTLRGLLHSTLPSTLPLFQSIGKSLLPRRNADQYIRQHHLGLAAALAKTTLSQLRPLRSEATIKDYHYWIIMFHTVHEMLIDPTRLSDRNSTQLIIPVLVAFKEYGGFDVLNSMLERFAEEIREASPEGEWPTKSKLAAVGMKKILEIYAVVVGGKNVTDSLAHTTMTQRTTEKGKEYGAQLVVELRMALLPVVRKLWESEMLVEKLTTENLKKIIEILKTIASADQETNAYRRADKTSPVPIFKNREISASFNWSSTTYQDLVKTMSRTYDDEELAREAVYRALGKHDEAGDYCRAHQKGTAGKRNPIPEAEAYRPLPSPKSTSAEDGGLPSADLLDAMTLDTLPGINSLIRDIAEPVHFEEDQSSDESGDEGRETSSQHSAPQDSNLPPTAAAAATSTDQAVAGEVASPITKDDLDEERTKLHEDLIDRCLDVIRAHPESVHDVSELISQTILKANNEDKRTEVAEVLANALMSFSVNDEEERKSSGPSIAAYAHLLCLLLKQPSFFKATLPTLKQNTGEYLGFLKVPPVNSNEELPPWLPHVLLIFELMLADDAQPLDVRWTQPSGEDDVGDLPVLVPREGNLSNDERSVLLSTVLDILPRVAKEEILAVSVLRILVILTRDDAIAKIVGEKRNLQRLFLMAKQLCGVGSHRLKASHITDSIMIVLRHIVEDEQIIRQIMQAEIRQYMINAQRNPRAGEINTYLRHLSHVALRSPKIFIDVTLDMTKLSRISQNSMDGPPRGAQVLVLKDSSADSPASPKDTSIEPAVQATEDLTISDVKPSTEAVDKEMPDVLKTPAQELKRPVLENPDGVIHFLLCELLNYKEVDDKEPALVKDSKAPAESPGPSADGTSVSGEEQPFEAKDKDKKSSKPVFRAEDHPIFIYRCFLLNCLAELLQSFNRAKVEFINFKRSAPIQTNTPIKPRSSVLNYLLNDLLFSSQNSPPSDSLVYKKKIATSAQAQAVLVALVARTGEKPLDRNLSNYEYDDEPDLLFVRRFVLDTILRAYKETSSSGEPLDVRYGKMISLAELMSQIIGEKDKEPISNTSRTDPGSSRSHTQLKRLMFEKGYLAALTASIADIDIAFPNVKRTMKYILRVLRSLSKTVYDLSQAGIIARTAADQHDDEILSSSSLSDIDSEREETPDLYRNSTLGMLEPGLPGEFSEGSEDGKCFLQPWPRHDTDILVDDDDDMYGEEAYDDELDYGEEMSQDGEDNPSDDEEEISGMGAIEGLSGEPGVVEVIMGENDDDEDMDDDDDEPTDDDDDDDLDSDDMEDAGEQIEIVGDEGNVIDDDGASAWESDTDEEGEDEDEDEVDYEAEVQDLHEADLAFGNRALNQFPSLMHSAIDADDLDEEGIRDFEEHYVDDGVEDEGKCPVF